MEFLKKLGPWHDQHRTFTVLWTSTCQPSKSLFLSTQTQLMPTIEKSSRLLSTSTSDAAFYDGIAQRRELSKAQYGKLIRLFRTLPARWLNALKTSEAFYPRIPLARVVFQTSPFASGPRRLPRQWTRQVRFLRHWRKAGKRRTAKTWETKPKIEPNLWIRSCAVCHVLCRSNDKTQNRPNAAKI